MDVLGIPTNSDTASILDAIRLGRVLTGIMLLVATWFAVRITTGTLSRLGNRFVSKRLVLAQVATLCRFVIYLLGFMLAIGAAIPLSREVVMALAGTAAVTIGFALKDLAASVLAGITILIDRPFQVGDRVQFGPHYGEITQIGLRSVRLLTLETNVVTIPNNKFLTEVVSSSNLGDLDMMVQHDFYIGIDQDIALAKRLVAEATTGSHYAFVKKNWIILVKQVVIDNYFAIRIRSKANVLDVQYEKAFESDVTERVMKAFREHGIMPPAVIERLAESTPSTTKAA
ncbi:MAG: mechanosensitive ion channel family protein [Polyangiaceae bacterium]|nr:mechanosensitive ion channel family protein [Polyangiaceae bacterium]